jgi:hypothetical protein
MEVLSFLAFRCYDCGGGDYLGPKEGVIR